MHLYRPSGVFFCFDVKNDLVKLYNHDKTADCNFGDWTTQTHLCTVQNNRTLRTLIYLFMIQKTCWVNVHVANRDIMRASINCIIICDIFTSLRTRSGFCELYTTQSGRKFLPWDNEGWFFAEFSAKLVQADSTQIPRLDQYYFLQRWFILIHATLIT